MAKKFVEPIYHISAKYHHDQSTGEQDYRLDAILSMQLSHKSTRVYGARESILTDGIPRLINNISDEIAIL